MDEVNLLRNFLERSYIGLFRPLIYGQYSPPLFSVLMKAAVQVLGTGERAIRLLPVLASVGALVLLARLAWRWLAPVPALLAVAWVATGWVYLDFGTVCKQYAADGVVALALLAAAEAQIRRPTLGGPAAAGWLAAGAVAVWCSMPSVFCLAGVGLCLAWRYRTALWGPVGLRLAAVGAAWAASFLVYFLLLLKADAQSSYLQQYHSNAFLAFPPHSGAEWQLLGQQLTDLLDKTFGKTVLAQGLGGLGVVLGTGALLRRQPGPALLLLVPLAACLTASALHYYSMISRLLLFALPLLTLVAARGWQVLLTGRRPWRPALVLLALGMALGNFQRLANFWQPFRSDFADVRAGLRHAAAHRQSGDTLFVPSLLEPVYAYYARLHPAPLRLPPAWLPPARPAAGSYEDQLQADLAARLRPGAGRLWVVYDRPDPWLRTWAARRAPLADTLTFYRGYAFALPGR